MLEKALLDVLNKVPADDVDFMKNLFSAIEVVHQILYDRVSNVTEAVKKQLYSNEELADIGFFFREMENLFDECRKEVKARKDLVSKVLAFSVAQDSVMNPEADPVVRGKYARASADVVVRPKIPKPGTPGHTAAMKFFGVTDEMVASGILKFDWNKVSHFLSVRAENGEAFPEGLNETYTECICTYTRTRKEESDGKEN